MPEYMPAGGGVQHLPTNHNNFHTIELSPPLQCHATSANYLPVTTITNFIWSFQEVSFYLTLKLLIIVFGISRKLLLNSF